jgi:hypothetical protein
LGVRCYINNKPRELIAARVEKNGTRAIDSSTFTFSRSVAITKGDSITYLQDPTNIKYLVGVWNFFDNTRDESGYDLDGDESTYETDGTYHDGCDGRVIKLISSTKSIKISNDNHLDFSAQFDIVLWINKPDWSGQNNTSYCFGKGDSSNSIEIQHTTVSGSASNIKATIIKGGTTYTLEASTPTNILNSNTDNSSGYHFVRLKRDENDLVTLMVDGITEDTDTISGDIATGNTYLYLGADKSGSNIWNGYMAQCKIYSGSYLTNEDYIILRQTRRQPNTMKFGGTVWKIDEKPTHKIVHCKSFAKVLHDSEINTDDSTITWTSGDSDINKNNYLNKNGFEILTDLLYVMNTGIKTVDVHGNITGSNRDYEEYTARGTLYENILILTINGAGDSSFTISARKILRLEDDDIDYFSGGIVSNKYSPITFKEGVVNIINLGYDDSSTTTYVTAISKIEEYKKEQTKLYNDFDSVTHTEVILQRKPIDVKVTHATDGEISWNSSPSSNMFFKVETDNRKIILGGAANTSGVYTIEYTYENIYDPTALYTASSGDISTLGRISKTLYLPQIVKAGSNMNLFQFVQRYLAKFSTLNRRVTVRVPTLVNHIRENYKVKVIDDKHNAGTTAIPLNISIRSMIYYYPEGITEVNLGDHSLDSFDLDSALGGALHELRSNISKTQP